MDLLDTAAASRYLHLHPKRVQALARDGRLPGRRVGRKWLFARHDLDRMLGHEPLAIVGLDLSARNQLRGTVSALTIDGVMAEVHLQIGDQSLVSIITRGAAERLQLKVGDPVVAVIKSTEVMVGKAGTAV
ncbi:MAG TPA: TOBE domain-containing protein [Gemmatimonadales bacterium]|nr:TOBE domain-containing protein [Gemmatimonadales bacterium]